MSNDNHWTHVSDKKRYGIGKSLKFDPYVLHPFCSPVSIVCNSFIPSSTLCTHLINSFTYPIYIKMGDNYMLDISNLLFYIGRIIYYMYCIRKYIFYFAKSLCNE